MGKRIETKTNSTPEQSSAASSAFYCKKQEEISRACSVRPLDEVQNTPQKRESTEQQVSFGRELQLERQRRRVSLESIAEGTKVPLRHLRALEQEEYAQLPGGIFNKGILRNYCNFLGLDEHEWLPRLPNVAPPASEQDWESFAENVRRSRVGKRSSTGAQWLGVLVMLLVLVALGLAAWRVVLRPQVMLLPQAGQMVAPAQPLNR
jgi:cytoskeleton protein RodZ